MLSILFFPTRRLRAHLAAARFIAPRRPKAAMNRTHSKRCARFGSDPAGAKRLECARLQRRFSPFPCQSFPCQTGIRQGNDWQRNENKNLVTSLFLRHITPYVHPPHHSSKSCPRGRCAGAFVVPHATACPSVRRAGFPACRFTGLSSSVFPVGLPTPSRTGDWKACPTLQPRFRSKPLPLLPRNSGLTQHLAQQIGADVAAVRIGNRDGRFAPLHELMFATRERP